jgi:hypothetical protein
MTRPTAAFLVTTAVAGLESGKLGVGLKAGLIAAATAVAFYEVGNLTDMISGAPVGTHAPPSLSTEAGFVAGLVINTALGGGAAVLGGGKFENGID